MEARLFLRTELKGWGGQGELCHDGAGIGVLAIEPLPRAAQSPRRTDPTHLREGGCPGSGPPTRHLAIAMDFGARTLATADRIMAAAAEALDLEVVSFFPEGVD